MAALINSFVIPSVYNSLPHINAVSKAPIENSNDLEILRALLVKYDVPKDFSIRLIHKHYDALEGEVMVFDRLELPAHGTVQMMRPVAPSGDSGLHGIHYFVNKQGDLQAYEYANCGVPDVSRLGAFFTEFCRTVNERNLQNKFGLKIKTVDELDQTGWTEYELHGKRTTVMFPDGMPQPQVDAFEEVGHEGSGYTVTTEWLGFGENKRGQTNCKHKTQCSHGSKKCTHCKHCSSHNIRSEGDTHNEKDLCIDGHVVQPGIPVHEILRTVVEAF